MSEKAILNAKATWDNDIQDNICPDYGFGAKLPSTRVTAKPPGGQPFSRETQNSGHTFSLSWLNRSFQCAQRIRHFHQQYEDGYFTLIDKDGGGRHYVGRFTGEFNRVQNANDSYSIQDLTFEEVPGAPMLEYPSDWEHDAIDINVFSDSGKPRASTTGTWYQATHEGEITLDNPGNAGDSATIEYRGYGFQIWALQGTGVGMVKVLLDGVLLATVDLYAANGTVPLPQNLFNQATITNDVLIDSTTGATNSAAAGVSFFVSDYIPCTPGTSYTKNAGTVAAFNFGTAFYDSSKTYISGVADTGSEPLTVTAPAGAAFFRFGAGNNTTVGQQAAIAATVMVTPGATVPSSYVPYTPVNATGLVAKVFAKGDVPLDLHRVTLQATGTKNSASSSAAVSWATLEVMR